ncbi:MAG: hypothetical protein QOG46_1876 [Pseudonocardiales bacterium]|nr:hypothetical protein [Pseudonocardiales bacterium]
MEYSTYIHRYRYLWCERQPLVPVRLLVSLPTGIKADQASAALTGGVRTVQVPKSEPSRSWKTPISS